MTDRTDIENIASTESHEVQWKGSTTDSESSAGSPRKTQPTQQSSSCKRRLITLVFFIVLAIVAAVGLSIAFLGQPNPVEFFVQEDPPGRNETHEWQTFGFDGLELIIENALVDSWTPYLDEYIEKWDAGADGVDPLTLSVKRVEPDFHCDPTPGRLKVCNGDYGRNDWRGINIILLQNGYIAHSVAKLNDYWLQKEGIIQMRYTMCHELGHGFGLAHTDENYWNINTGECMDYSTRPRSNLDPGLFNFELLAGIYGTTTPRPVSSTTTDSGNLGNRRRAGSVLDGLAVPSSVKDKYFKAVEQIESRICRDCLVDLGDGYQLEIHQLGVGMEAGVVPNDD